MSELDGSEESWEAPGGVRHTVPNVERDYESLLRVSATDDRRPGTTRMDGSDVGAQSLNEVGHVIQQRQFHCNG